MENDIISRKYMLCSECNAQAFFSQRHNNRSLCARHFIEDFEQRAKNAILDGHLAEDGDRIAVAVSGGKDSVALLYVLRKILAGRRVRLFAITVDEGIEGYREDTMKCACKISEKLNIDQEIISFQEEYGFELDHAVRKGFRPCAVCGVFRKKALNTVAKRMGATKVATGHNLDDEVQSIMMNYLKGDIQRLARLRPRRHQVGLVPRIKPLQKIPEKEVALYAMAMGIFEESRECPYASQSLRSDVRAMMNRLENQFPGTKHSTLIGYDQLLELGARNWAQIDLSSCKKCGEPCAKDLCKACELLAKLKM